MELALSHISSVCGGRLSPTAAADKTINGFFTDSRHAESQKLFLALRGEKTDGNSFVGTVIGSGCAAMTDREENLLLRGDIIYVPDVRKALLRLAAYWRDTVVCDIPFVGITGSVGKTTTKDMVSLALSSGVTVRKTIGNANSQLGLPQTVLSVEKTDGIAVVELGMSFPGEMERIAECAKPNISIITNIGHSHIENLGSRENILKEKLKITEFSPEGSFLLLNGDEPLLRGISISGRRILYVSEADKTASAYAEDVCETDCGLSFKAFVEDEQVNVVLNVPGRHNILNALFALLTCKLNGLDLKLSAAALENYKSDGKRQYIFTKNGYTVISDCYNASPESMAASLAVLKNCKGRRIAVLGDMLELGDSAASLHREVGYAAGLSADVLVTYGTLAENIFAACDLPEKYSFCDIKELKNFLDGYLAKGDTVLYKASNGMHLGEAI